MPLPTSLASEISEDGRDLRIPSPVPQPTELDIHAVSTIKLSGSLVVGGGWLKIDVDLITTGIL